MNKRVRVSVTWWFSKRQNKNLISMRFLITKIMNPNPSKSIGSTALFSQKNFIIDSRGLCLRIEPIHTIRAL